MQTPSVISLVYFAACVIYFFAGFIILSYNVKSKMHWLLFCCCLDLSIWAFSFSVGNVAADYQNALLWRRIASIGWGSLVSYFLHYTLLLTDNKLLKKKWIYVLIYLPAFMNIFLFGVYTKTAVQSYHLVQTQFGWINISRNSLLDWYYEIYYIAFTVLSIVLLMRRGIASTNHTTRRPLYVVSISCIVSAIFGALTENILNSHFQVIVPQLAPVIILIPLSAFMYCILKYKLMGEPYHNEILQADDILDENTKSKLYFYLSTTYVIAGFVNFGVQFFSNRENLIDVIIFSSSIFALGLAVGVIQVLSVDRKLKQLLSNITFIASIPIMILKYPDVSGVYAWAVPVIIMLVAVAFSQRHMLYLISLATYATLAWLWIKTPIVNITFSSADHISRIIIMTIIIWFMFFVNRTYVQIINRNKEKVKLERMLNHISNMFIVADSDNISESILECMRVCGDHLKLECIHLIFLSKGRELTGNNGCFTYHSPMSGCRCTREKLLDMILEAYPDKLLLEGSLFTTGARTVPAEREFLESMGLKSLVVRPMRIQNETTGYLFLGSSNRILSWGNEQQQTASLIIHMITDLWSKMEAQKALVYQASYDALTGLPNRINFYSRLSQAIDKAKSDGKYVGVIYIDIDSFKSVNDSMGHQSGDHVLIQMSKALQDSIRPEDFLARFGGDEFILMTPLMDTMDDIRKHTEGITDSYKKTYTVKGQEFHLSVSSGIAVYPIDGTDPETLIKNADLAMYKSKELGKNRYTYCSEEMKAETYQKIRLAEDLHRALERQEMRLYYQPQVFTVSNRITGIEALLRWFHPEFGFISPGLFIPLAEQTGLIAEIGDWVMHEACLQCKRLHMHGWTDLRVSVNVSVVQLQNPGFMNRVNQILQETQLEPQSLELEITESATTNECYNCGEVLGSLKELGVSIAIDDFGTEYSSLDRLCNMPIDCIKLDISFTRGIGKSEKYDAIVSGIIGLSHALGLKAIAEGVETESQLDFLKESGIDEIQGFYFYKPMPPDELESILSKVTCIKEQLLHETENTKKMYLCQSNG